MAAALLSFIAAAQTPTGGIEAAVVDRAGRAPIAGATVELEQDGQALDIPQQVFFHNGLQSLYSEHLFPVIAKFVLSAHTGHINGIVLVPFEDNGFPTIGTLGNAGQPASIGFLTTAKLLVLSQSQLNGQPQVRFNQPLVGG